MTSTAHWTEPSANVALGRRLGRMLPSYTVRYENTQQIVGQPALQPDILITANGRAPVVIEAEFMPAYTAEPEAKDRLGLEVRDTARTIDAAIALRYPEGADSLPDAVSEARLSYCVCYEDGTRFPESGWLEGSVEDLADLVRLVSVPQPFSASSQSPGRTSSPASRDCSECRRCCRRTVWLGPSSRTRWCSTSGWPDCTM